MTARRTRRLAFVAAAPAMLGGCLGNEINDDGSSLVTASGTARVDYAADRTGTFSATGELRATNGVIEFRSFAIAVILRQDRYGLVAIETSGTQDASQLALDIGGVVEGATIPFGGAGPAACVISNPCVSAATLTLGGTFNPRVTAVTGGTTYQITSGTLTVTALTLNRIAGTFSAEGFLNGDTSRRITLRNGTFDVPIVRQS